MDQLAVGVYGDGKVDGLWLKNFEAVLTRVGAKINALTITQKKKTRPEAAQRF